MKVCRTCKKRLPLSSFEYTAYGERLECRQCRAERYKNKYHSDQEFREQELVKCRLWQKNNKAHIREYWQKNKKKYLMWAKQWRERNKDKVAENNKKWKEKNRDKVRLLNKIWRQNNLEKARVSSRKCSKNHRKERQAYWRSKYQSDSIFKMTDHLRNRIRKVLKSCNTKKSLHSIKLLGCNPFQLKNYIENKFNAEMSWENYGRLGWHLDHVRPLASFDLSDPEQQKIAFHYTNLQPLWWHENLKKGKKFQVT